ncbi:HPr kinase/phosphorylase [Radicibacter daui]|uniref:HPr kinase/phosphorylase n=1 Tax=Radicibacter daui TaxID=3064829 RepID=UPI004046A40B
MTFHYYAYGLHLDSDIRLPGFLPWPGPQDAPADVEIRKGPVPETLAGTTYQGPFLQVAGAMTARYAMRGIAAYLIEDGNRITVSAEPEGTEQDVALFMSGTVFGVLCHQRGRFPLHAACVEIAGRAVAFAGDSGTGKSTLAAALSRRGFRLLADDVSVIDTHAPDGPMVMPALPRQGLWQDSLSALDLVPGRHIRSSEELEKFERTVGTEFLPEPRPLDTIFHLRVHRLPGKPVVERLAGFPAIQATRAQIYRLHAAQRMGLEQRLFLDVGRIAPKVQHYLLRRPQNFKALPDFIAAVLDTVGQTASPP